ncbi:hypothetical protein Poli38472_012259 [Pythium oligandrum]|uniref:Bola-like protein n=1 Tax=Pythium oligandrum TaxID=41045 RepID=A0A8K1CQI8_PYTOL|nr:hypothetical protein Poli38472_012259 [Pythium oligandrum]|eukprot:TMW67143.1 hypothetical protein Poli38472_012259 [Pythium oligandrum]
MSVVTPSHLEAKLRSDLGALYVEASDLSDGCGQKFSLVVVHDGFEGQSLLDRQRRVNECLKEEMTRIHALQMKTWTRAQYEQKMQQPVPTSSQTTGEN